MANENLLGLFEDVNPTEIASHIEAGNLRTWCRAWRDAAKAFLPTVDAVEVVHAYWTGSRFNPMTGEYEEYCSHCCAWSSEYGKPYCPNCGAKMDGGNEDV